MTLERVDEYVVEVEAEAGAVFGAGGTWGGSELKIAPWELDVASATNTEIEDPSYTVDGGAHESIVGVPDINVPFSTHMLGLGTAAGSGVAPTATAFSTLLGSHMQSTPDLITGDVVKTGSSPRTTTSFQGATNDRGNPANGTIGIVGVTLATGVEWRPYTYAAATDTYTLLIALSAAPEEGAVLYGGIGYSWAQDWNGAVVNTLGVQLLANDAAQHKRLFGAIAKMSIPQMSGRDVCKAAWQVRARAFTEPSETRSAVANRGSVLAGGQFLLADYGSAKTGLALRIRSMQVDFPDIVPDDGAGDVGNIGGYTRKGKSPITARLVVPHNQSMPSGISAANYNALWNTGDTDNQMQLLLAFGGTPGRTVVHYMTRVLAKRPERHKAAGETDSQTLILQPIAGMTEAHCHTWVC